MSSTLKNYLEREVEEYRTLEKEHQQVLEQNSGLKEENLQLNRENWSLKMELQQSHDEIEKLTSIHRVEIKKLTSARSSSIASKEYDLKLALFRLESDVGDMEKKNIKDSLVIDELNEKLLQHDHETDNQLKNQMTEMEKSRSDLRKIIMGLESEIRKLKPRIHQFESILHSFDKLQQENQQQLQHMMNQESEIVYLNGQLEQQVNHQPFYQPICICPTNNSQAMPEGVYWSNNAHLMQRS